MDARCRTGSVASSDRRRLVSLLMASPPPGPAHPSTLGRYRVFDRIGEGSMASVYLARADDPAGAHRWIAIKRMHPHLAEDAPFVDMLFDEARITADIQHTNVVEVLELGKDDDTYWLAME